MNTAGGTLTLNGTATAKTVTINNNTAALTVTLTDNHTIVGTGTTSKWNVAGNANVTMVVADDGSGSAISDIEGIALTKSGTGTVTVKINDTASSTTNLTEFAADVVNMAVTGTAAVLVNVNEGSTVNFTGNTTAVDIATIGVGNATSGAYTAGEGTLIATVSQNLATNALTTSAAVGTLLISATPDAVTDTDANSNGIVDTRITITELDTATSGYTETVVISGSADLSITKFTNDDTASVLSATQMTGKLTIGTTTAAGTFVLGSGNDNVAVGNVASTIHGNGGNDTITGGRDADIINGNDGDDIIAGGITGLNTINGGAGNDTITVTGAETDTITLGAGNDTVITAVDLNATITDFNTAEDTIVVTGAATANVDLTNITPTTGAYQIGTGLVAAFTLTGLTTTNISGFVQLGNVSNTGVYSAYTALDTGTVVAGAKNDVIAVATTTDATITTGAGSDIVILATGATSAVTVNDFTVGSDKIIITGTAASTSLNLTSVTATAGAYALDTNAVVTLSNGGTAFTATDLSAMVQLGTSSAAAYVVAASSSTATTTTGGIFNDFIAGNTNADTIKFINNGGMDTITSFTTTNDKLSFDLLTNIGATGTAVAVNAAKVVDAVDGSVYVFANASDGTGSEAISTFTADSDGNTAATILTDVAAFLNAGLGSTTGETYVAYINIAAGTSGYAYLVHGNTAGITSADITLIGQVASSAAVDYSNIA